MDTSIFDAPQRKVAMGAVAKALFLMRVGADSTSAWLDVCFNLRGEGGLVESRGKGGIMFGLVGKCGVFDIY